MIIYVQAERIAKIKFELCQGVAVNADVSPNLLKLDRSLKGATTRLVA